MDRPIRTLVWISGVLAVASFVYIMVFAPVTAVPHKRATTSRRAAPSVSIGQMDQAFRGALASGDVHRAAEISRNMVRVYPNNRVTWFCRGVILEELGQPDKAELAWNNLLQYADALEVTGARQLAQRDYYIGWGVWGISGEQASREHFRRAADSYVESFSGADASAADSYNLACYRAMAGQAELALGHWGDALRLGFSDQSKWWKKDPDLDPIRDDPRFVEIARRHGYSE